LHGSLSHLVGKKELTIPYEANITVKQITDRIIEIVPQIEPHLLNKDKTNLLPWIVIAINGHSIKLLQGLNTQIEHNSDEIRIERVDFIHQVGGG
ncbi:MAG: MoaD/ThiS family protein, partial [Candidatus Thorarchaeota archaeon]